MKRLLLLGTLAVSLAGCIDPEGAQRALVGAGYAHIELSRPSYWGSGCGDSDDYATRFKAVGPTGVPVSGVVCAGAWGKGSTIRMD